MNEKLSYDLTPEMKEILVEIDFNFFLEKNILVNNYTQENINLIYIGKKKEDERGKADLKKNKKQELLYLEGNVAKMVRGFLPSFFNMNETRKFTITFFEEIGKNWSEFETWKKYEKRKIRRNKVWDTLTKSGVILAFILSAIKLLEIFGQYKYGK